jgi:ribonucleoside-diphosphate reductase subunit M1
VSTPAESSASEAVTPAASSSASESAATTSTSPTTPSTSEDKEVDPEYAAALERLRQRQYEEEKLMCSLENKEACLMCSG